MLFCGSPVIFGQQCLQHLFPTVVRRFLPSPVSAFRWNPGPWKLAVGLHCRVNLGLTLVGMGSKNLAPCLAVDGWNRPLVDMHGLRMSKRDVVG
jgi:hypothetical protein